MTKELERAVAVGHHRNPKYPDAWELDLAHAKLISPDHKAAKAVMASYQEYHKELLDNLTLVHHKRASIADGDVGPATEELMELPRCGCPDFYVADEPRLAALWNPAEPQAANWPTSCRSKLVMNYLFDNLPGLNTEETEDVFVVQANIWTRVIDDLKLRIDRTIKEAARLDIYAGLKPLPGGTLAWSFLARDTCQVSLEQAYDTTIRWSWNQACATATHEVGHALGLNHNNTAGSTMYPSITGTLINRLGWPIAVDLSQMRRLGYEVSDLNPTSPGREVLTQPWWEQETPDPGPGPQPPDGPTAGLLVVDGKIYDVIRRQ